MLWDKGDWHFYWFIQSLLQLVLHTNSCWYYLIWVKVPSIESHPSINWVELYRKSAIDMSNLRRFCTGRFKHTHTCIKGFTWCLNSEHSKSTLDYIKIDTGHIPSVVRMSKERESGIHPCNGINRTMITMIIVKTVIDGRRECVCDMI